MEKITNLENVGMANISSRGEADKRLIALMMKIQSAQSIEEAKELANLALGDTYESRMIGSLTNSPIGSSHWHGTLLANIAHIGEYMQKHELDEKVRTTWGKQIEDYSRHLMKNFNKIPFNY
jgi:hypothetical protein